MWTINRIIETGNLPKLDSLTKYPSILTYHNLGQKGGMVDSLVDDKRFEGKVEITEKVDGTNFRLVVLGDDKSNDFLVGKRDSLLYAKGDRIMTESLVQTVLDSCKPYLDYIEKSPVSSLYVIFGEVYGDNVQRGAKQYCGSEKRKGFRVFDVAVFSQEDLDEVFSYDLHKIAAWREAGMNKFMDTSSLADFCNRHHLERTPIWGEIDASEIPVQVEETLDWMEKNFTQSRSTFGEKPENANPLFGRAEGIVIRTPDRSMIRKLRFEDYRKGKLKGWV